MPCYVANIPRGVYGLCGMIKKERNLRSHLSHQLSMDFGDTIDGARSLYAEIWRRVAGGSGTEGTDGAGDKQTQAVLRCNVQDVVKP